MTDRDLIDQLAAIRRARRIKQSTVGRRAGMHTSYISKLENQDYHPQLDTILRYAAAIGVQIGITGVDE
jgi:transcriptional regulator with XRE-family HTH domain